MGMLEELNDRQREAVLTTEGPVLVLAGAGSGKTRALTYRIAYLIRECKVNPRNILAITFTNKAAGEMKERVDRLVPEGAGAVWVSTFHSMCVRILRRFADRVGYGQDFTIYDADDQKALMRQIIKQLDLDPKTYREKNILSEISAAKNEMQSPEDMDKTASGNFMEMQTARLYHEYQKECRKNNAMDFDDLIFYTVELLAQNPDVKDLYQERFRYILVDEYQDTNTAQFRLIEHLAGKYKNLCVVGDDDQSIYRFRGANIRNILDFEKAYPGAAVVRLEQNYRSTQNILDAAGSVIANNEGRKEKKLWTENGRGEKVRYREYDSAELEAMAVVQNIEKAVNMGAARRDCAILYRTNAQSRILEEICVRYNMPYRLIGGVNFYQRLEIKDVLAYLKTIGSGRDDLAAQRIINVPRRGIGAASIAKVGQYASERDESFFAACEHADQVPGLGKAAGKVKAFANEIHEYRKLAEDLPLDGLIREILERTGYMDELRKDLTPEGDARKENVEELISKAAEYVKNASESAGLNDFLEQVALVADVSSGEEDSDRVFLMTLHSAKGLEFDYVYLTGMEDGLFPGYMAITADTEEDMEEERRLCYVGMTRAKRHLFLSGARRRMVNGAFRANRRSRFIDEVDPEVLDRVDSGFSFAKGREEEGQEDRERSAVKTDPGESTWSGRAGGFSSGKSAPDWRDDTGETVSSFYGKNSFENHPSSMSRRSRERQESHAIAQEQISKMLSMYQRGSDLSKSAEKELEYAVGDRVSHVKFGQGTVMEISKQKTDYQVTVDFDTAGIRKMYAGFAKLKKIEE